jgi:hypothetical protein
MPVSKQRTGSALRGSRTDDLLPKNKQEGDPVGPAFLQHAPPFLQHAPRRSRGFILSTMLAAVVGMTTAGGAAYAASNRNVGFASNSSSEAQLGSIKDLSIAAVPTSASTNRLFPGGNGDVVVAFNNPNAFAVTVTGVNLPTNTTYATGYSSSALIATQPGCLASTPSDVIWSFSTTTSGSAHTLKTPLTVAAGGTLIVTFTDDISMTTRSPAACEATYFSMPSLTGIAAVAASGDATVSPAVDAWTG